MGRDFHVRFLKLYRETESKSYLVLIRCLMKHCEGKKEQRVQTKEYMWVELFL